MRVSKWLMGIVLVVLAATVLVRTFAQMHKDPPDQEEAVQALSRVSVVNGQTVLALDAATQKRLGIVMAPLHAVDAQQQIVAAGMVLTVQDLISLRNAYIAARAQVLTTQASTDASRAEYQRLTTLYKQNQNTSRKSLEAAQATFSTSQADLNAAQEQLQNAKSAAESSWGSEVGGWVANNSPNLEQVFNQRELMVQVTLAPGSSFAAPRWVELSMSGAAAVRARYISPFPRVDPRILGISLLYEVGSTRGLSPGMTVIARLPAGPLLKGVLVPRAAIVWWQGQAWAYVQTAATHFTRKLVPTATPLNGGYFAATGLMSGSKVVTKGAEALLSEEFRSQIQEED